MALKFVSLEKLTYFAQKISALFVKKEAGKGLSQNDLTNALKSNYDKAYTHSAAAHAPSSAEKNVIVEIQKNGTNIAPDASRKVNITLGALADKSAVAESDLESTLKTKINNAATHAGAAHAPVDAEKNAIVGVKIDGTALTIDTGRNITLGKLADNDTVSLSDLEVNLKNQIHTHSNAAVLNNIDAADVDNWAAAYAHSAAAHAPSDAQANKIESIKVNGAAQTISSKAVDIKVPTTVAGLSDAGNYALNSNVYSKSETYSKSEVNSKLSSVYRYKGSVPSYASLPTAGANGVETGDVYNVEAADKAHGVKAGDNVAWDGKAWDVLSGLQDLSGYVQTADLTEVTEAEIDAMFA